MKEAIPKFMVAVVGIAITALLAALIFTMFDDNEMTYKEASKHIETLDNKERGDDGWTCPECGTINDKYALKCRVCGEQNPWRHD